MSHHDVLIVGGGTAGITVAAQLQRTQAFPDIALIEPSEDHFYQPLWTLVGGGVFPKEESRRREADFVPQGVHWIRDAVTACDPVKNTVRTRDGRDITYRFLVLCPGFEIFWDRVKGLPEAIGKDGVCSNYSYEHVESTWRFIQEFKGGNAVFTMPSTPIKCGGAPQKIMYLAEDYFRKAGTRNDAKITFATGGPSIFAVKKYAEKLSAICDLRGLDRLFRHNLVEVRAHSKEAVFEQLDTKAHVVLPYDLLHVTPPMGPPKFIRESVLADGAGFIDVDKFSLQHTRFKNVFGLGDASSLPTSRTGAAIRKQAPVVVQHLLALRAGKPLEGRYDGYTSCPLVTGYGKLILAEFDYNNAPCETFPFDQSKERASMYYLKKYGLPALYWHVMLRGRG